MAKILQIEGAPVREPVTGPRGLLSFDWERWFHRLPDWILKRPSCHVYFTADQTIATATETDVLFDAEDHDNAGFHSTTSNTDRLTIPSDGIYFVGAALPWASNVTGYRRVRITLNDASPVAAAAIIAENLLLATASTTGLIRHNCHVVKEFSAGDILRCQATQTSGGNLDLQSTVAHGFWCFMVSK